MQEVNRNEVTDHNINDEYMKNAPTVSVSPILSITNLTQYFLQNTSLNNPDSVRQTRESYKQQPSSLEEGMGVLGHPESGRIKHDQVAGDMANESSVHPRNPPS